MNQSLAAWHPGATVTTFRTVCPPLDADLATEKVSAVIRRAQKVVTSREKVGAPTHAHLHTAMAGGSAVVGKPTRLVLFGDSAAQDVVVPPEQEDRVRFFDQSCDSLMRHFWQCIPLKPDTFDKANRIDQKFGLLVRLARLCCVFSRAVMVTGANV